MGRRPIDPLAGLAAMLDSVTPAEASALAALATSTVAQAIAFRRLPWTPQGDDSDAPQYTPHPLDVLIFAAIEQEGALQMADMLAALQKDTYPSRGKDRKVTGTALKNRLPELVDLGILRSTTAGYLIADKHAAATAEDCFSAAPPRPLSYVPHPLDVLVYAAIDQEGAMQQAELLAALGSDTYTSRGKDRPVTAGTLQRRLPELVGFGALIKTPAGYIVADESYAAMADMHFDGRGVDRESPRYIPHPLDVLIFAAIDQDGAMGQAAMLAALGGDTYTSQGQDRRVSAGTLKRRLPELVACGALVKTAGGYVIQDRDAIDVADSAFR